MYDQFIKLSLFTTSKEETGVPNYPPTYHYQNMTGWAGLICSVESSLGFCG